jgi:uncharacterized phage protein gp47/JayE
MTYGLTALGFWPKPIERIRLELQEAARAAFGEDIDVDASPMVELIEIPASALREVWELMASVSSADDPDTAEGAQLEQLAALTGTDRRAATKSRVTLSLSLNAGTTIPSGSIVSAPVTGSRWLLTETVGPFGFSVVGHLVVAECSVAGPVAAGPSTITQIETPVAGWTGVSNPTAADPGAAIDDDVVLRARRFAELEASGAGTADTIRAAVVAVVTVESVVVNENATDFATSNLPPHSVEVLVWDGASPPAGSDALIAEAIWRTAPAGIELVGTISATIVDEQNTAQLVRFSRLSKRDVWLSIDVSIDRAVGFSASASDDLKARLSAWGDRYMRGGDDLIISKLHTVINATAGHLDTPSIRAGFAAVPVGTVNLSISPREIASLDASRIVVNATLV